MSVMAYERTNAEVRFFAALLRPLAWIQSLVLGSK